MHKIHCERNTVKCPKCGQKLNKSDLEGHMNDLHVLKKCATCSLEIENQHFASHDCPKKPVICDYCEASLPKDQISLHKVECGNRTEPCDRCREYIKKKDLAKHVRDRNCKDYHEKLRELEAKKEIERKKQIEISKENERRLDMQRQIELQREQERKRENERKKEVNVKQNEEEKKKKSRDEDVYPAPRNNAARNKLRDEEVKPPEGARRPGQGDKRTELSRQKPTNFNSIQKKGSGSKSDIGKSAKTGAATRSNIGPKPISKIVEKPVVRKENFIDPQDYEDFNGLDEQIPTEFDDNFFTRPEPRRHSPNPLTESRNFDDVEQQILNQILAESKKDSGLELDLDEDQLLNQVILESLKNK